MFPEWQHAVPESAYFKVPETLKTFRMHPISRIVYVLHCLANRLVSLIVQLIVMFLRKSMGNDRRRNICQKRLSERLDINKICGGFINIRERINIIRLTKRH